MRNRMILLTGLLLAAYLRAAPLHASVLELSENAPWAIEFETHFLWQGRNDAAIPGNTGSRFSLKELLRSPTAGARLEASHLLSQRHQLRAVIAPLTIRDSGSLSRLVSFQGGEFASSTETEGVFKFNSYRLGYRYQLFESDTWIILGGLTAKVRDATISLQQGPLYREKSNLGFVPLLHFAAVFRISENWAAETELDALAAPQGRAEDIRLGFRWHLPESAWSASFGYRILEGGADNKEVFTFSLFHYAFASIALRF